MKRKIRLSKCSLNNKEIKSVVKTLKSDFLGMGPNVNKFEKKLESFLVEIQFVFQVEPQLYI